MAALCRVAATGISHSSNHTFNPSVRYRSAMASTSALPFKLCLRKTSLVKVSLLMVTATIWELPSSRQAKFWRDSTVYEREWPPRRKKFLCDDLLSVDESLGPIRSVFRSMALFGALLDRTELAHGYLVLIATDGLFRADQSVDA